MRLGQVPAVTPAALRADGAGMTLRREQRGDDGGCGIIRSNFQETAYGDEA